MSSNTIAERSRGRGDEASAPSQSQTSSDDSAIDVGEVDHPRRTTRQGVTVPRIVFIKPDGERREVEAAEGESVMHAALNNLVDGIVGECGGDLSCATCHVFVDPEWFNALEESSADEQDMLEATSEEPTKFSRLSCQIKCHAKLNGLIVHLPATQRL